jgi:hypothetical protein
MSVERQDYGTLLEMFVGTTKTFILTIKDPDTGLAFDMSDTAVFNTGQVKIIQPDGTIIVTVAITYTDRPNGEVEFTIVAATAINTNAGNWKGEVELSNDDPIVIEQQAFNFNILESY